MQVDVAHARVQLRSATAILSDVGLHHAAKWYFNNLLPQLAPIIIIQDSRTGNVTSRVQEERQTKKCSNKPGCLKN
jgi:hypothetical protein